MPVNRRSPIVSSTTTFTCDKCGKSVDVVIPVRSEQDDATQAPLPDGWKELELVIIGERRNLVFDQRACMSTYLGAFVREQYEDVPVGFILDAEEPVRLGRPRRPTKIKGGVVEEAPKEAAPADVAAEA
jgi:hypothetical protein